ncbi:TetR/AcrR family transcriptional regulator [Streptomyces sp. NA04227]|uniref:TetR/AcrR family transcriptional regulator n=1 Tax=Streptomyces sp. NA04227 TaxID=2742136 RepID=UPI00159090B9|nr:TetR/AcrR family transcriptional regulator [Streptomyces sp. NA04227]QKW07881.1 TetR/AcrR family transcriptional regulator [Streptomyces sp. NA04227]
MAGRQAERSQETRSALIAAGTRLFGQRGYAAVGTEELVRAAGVTRGALYHQFKDKRALFDAVVEQVEAEVTRRVVADALTGVADPVQALRAGARGFLDACAEPEVERILLIDAPGVLGWERWRRIGEEHGLGAIIAALRSAIDAGALPEQPVRPLAHLVLGALDEAARLVARATDRETAREELLAAMEGLLFGYPGRGGNGNGSAK